jgi:succinate-semialdehyde dehydrogenase / glutarate-semialdehyde dehydrogenase
LEVKNPVTGALIGSVPVHSAEDVRAAVARARAAQPAWEAIRPKQRAAIFKAWGAALWDRQEEFKKLIRQETGKNDGGAFAEIATMEQLTLYYYHTAERTLRPQSRPALVPLIQRGKVYFKPYGVVGGLTPWNYPLYNAFCDIVPALIAGNTVVLKPSELTPFTAIKVVDVMYEMGLPRDALIIVTGDGSTGAALCEYADYITLTGSVGTAKKVAMKCAERLIPYTLELGGKDPLIILEDADLELAASGALRGALDNAGQMCISTKRVYVTEPIYDKFIERVKHYADTLNIGAGDGYDVHMGSLTHEREIERVEKQVAEAVSKGAKVIYGGKRRPDLGPLFYEPAVLTNVTHDMEMMQKETFGPVIPIVKVKDEDEAVRLANDSEFGLSSGIFTKDLARGERLALRIQAGDVGINRTQHVAGSHAIPWGGYKHSGVGRRGGPEGLLRFTQTHAVLTDTMIGQTPSLAIVDDMLLMVSKILRTIRRYVWI